MNFAQKAASHILNWGYYAATGANVRMSHPVQDTVYALGDMLVLGITALGTMLRFIVNSYKSTYLCFAFLLVQGTLSVITAAIDDFNTALATVSDGIRFALQSAIKSINDTVDGAVNIANDLLKILNKHVEAPPPLIVVPGLA